MVKLAPAVALGLVATGASRALWRTPLGLEPVSLLADQLQVVLSWAAALLACVGRERPSLVAPAAGFPAGVFVGLALTGLALFRATAPATWGALLVAGGLWLLTFARVLLRSRWTLAGLLVGGAAGAAQLSAHAPPRAATRPLDAALPEGPADTVPRLEFPCGPGRLEVWPLLTFTATSRDGFWPGLSTADVLEGAPPLEGRARRARLEHSADGWTAFVSVPHEVASHLNRFTDLHLHGAQQPRLAFDGVPGVFDFLPFDYPRGRPAQFAFARGRALTIARAHDAEKGPFALLASGTPAEQVLRLTFFDGARAWCTVEFDDFLPQADVENVSPTAGQGVTPSVIQFGLPGASTAPVPTVHLSLAETGIGAGRDTVRHAPGVYRNRARVLQR